MAKKLILVLFALALFAATATTAEARGRHHSSADNDADSVVMQGAYANTGENVVLGKADSDADAEGRHTNASARTHQIQTVYTGDALAMNAADVRTTNDSDCRCSRQGRGDNDATSFVMQGAYANSGRNVVMGKADSDADADADHHQKSWRRSRHSHGGSATATASTTQDQFLATGDAAAINWASVVTRNR